VPDFSVLKTHQIWEMFCIPVQTEGCRANVVFYGNLHDCIFSSLKESELYANKKEVTRTLTNLIVTLTLTLQLILQANKKLKNLLSLIIQKRDIHDALEAVARQLNLQIFMLEYKDQVVSLLILPNFKS